MNKNSSSNEANDIYDPYAEFSVNPLFLDIDYPEWNDATLNAEVWDEAKAKLGRDSSVYFEDLGFQKIPPKIEKLVVSWKKPEAVFPRATLTVYDPNNENFTLHVPSPLASCDLFDIFIEKLPLLQFLAVRYGFPVELETSGYVSNTQGEPWRPWHHIYSLCKAGKGAVHKPQYYHYGKYVLRLFYMGAWRRFVVDDRIPCDKKGLCIFPVTQVRGELWPIILMKGLIKILACPPYPRDISFLSIFTGWAEWRIAGSNKTYEEIWRRLILFTPKFELPGSDTVSLNTQNTSLRKESTKQTEEPCFVFANLKFSNSKTTIIVRMNRDRPLVKATRKESTKPWKKFRWVYWALKKGLWTDETKLPPYRLIYCMNFVHKLKKRLAPDPEHESLLFDIEEEEEENTTVRTNNKDNEDWYDYNKIYEFLTSLRVYFKPSVFTSIFKVTSLTSPIIEPEKKIKEGSTAGGKSKSKSRSQPASRAPPPEPVSSFFLSPAMNYNYNEPALMLCESTTGIFMCISLAVIPECSRKIEARTNEPEYLSPSFASLLVERFDWRTTKQGEIIGMTKTMGVSSFVLNIKPGRHVLKLWLSTNCPYVITVYSNVRVNVQKSPQLRFLLSNEAERILEYINKVSNAFISLTQKFGKPDLAASLKEFYGVIKPGNDGAPGYFKKVDAYIETFLECVLLSLKDLTTSNDELRIMMGALQSLFLDPKIYCHLPKSTTPLPWASTAKKDLKHKTMKKVGIIMPDRTLSEILSFPWSPETITRIIYIQKIFRGFRTRLLWKCQTPARPEFKFYTERLKKICDILFSPSKREVEVGKLLRKILIRKPELLNTLKFNEDFKDAIDVVEFTGKVANVEPFAWVPIARFMLMCSSDLPIPCAFYLTCNLEQSVIYGADNDTHEEIFGLTNGISPRYYQRNRKGYTIFIHGWNEAKAKTVNWRLHMVRMKYFNSLRICNMTMSQCSQDTLPVIEVSDLRSFYIPNSKTRLCRCLIKIRHRTLLTLRLSASYPGVSFLLTISLDKRFLSEESQGEESGEVAKVLSVKGAALISSLFLDHFENIYLGEVEFDHTVYILEALVLNNSWPLTKREWGVIEPFRVNGIAKDGLGSTPSKRSSTETRRKMSRRSSSEAKTIDHPFWFLQVVHEPLPQGSEIADDMVIEEDKSFAEFVKNMKYEWEEKDPGRRMRGVNLRKRFLKKIWIENTSFTTGSDDDMDISRGEDDENYPEFLEMLRRLSSFSYLLEDTSLERYHKSPRVLPEMPTDRLLKKYEREDTAACSLFNMSSTCRPSTVTTEVTGNLIEEAEAQELDFLMMCVHYRRIMTDHMKQERKVSEKLMKEAYELRGKAIKKLSRFWD